MQPNYWVPCARFFRMTHIYTAHYRTFLLNIEHSPSQRTARSTSGDAPLAFSLSPSLSVCLSVSLSPCLQLSSVTSYACSILACAFHCFFVVVVFVVSTRRTFSVYGILWRCRYTVWLSFFLCFAGKCDTKCSAIHTVRTYQITSWTRVHMDYFVSIQRMMKTVRIQPLHKLVGINSASCELIEWIITESYIYIWYLRKSQSIFTQKPKLIYFFLCQMLKANPKNWFFL